MHFSYAIALMQRECFRTRRKGFEQLTAWLKNRQVDNIHICMEATGSYSTCAVRRVARSARAQPVIAARYDVRTGNVTHVPDYGAKTYPVKIEDGKIMVSLSPGSDA